MPPSPQPAPKERDTPVLGRPLSQHLEIAVGFVKESGRVTCQQPPRSHGSSTLTPSPCPPAPAPRHAGSGAKRAADGPPSLRTAPGTPVFSQSELKRQKMFITFFFLTLGFPPLSRVNPRALRVAEAIPGFQPTGEESGSCLNQILD